MDAKRIVPVLTVREGRVVDPLTGGAQGTPSRWARRMELEGADELLFLCPDGPDALGWITAVARSLFIPFAVDTPADPRIPLDLGADRVILSGARLRSLGASLGRSRVLGVLDLALSRVAVERAIGDGAGELLLQATGQDVATVGERCARLSVPVLLRTTDPLGAAQALVHGADGLAYPSAKGSPRALKACLSGAGLVFRS